MNTKPELNEWTSPRGEHRRYLNNWRELAGIHVSHYNTGSIRSVEIDDYDGRVSNTKGDATATGKVWLDDNDELHFNYHSSLSLLTLAQKRERLIRALAAHGIAAK